jgi:maleylpyruvate isomerase
VGFHDLDLSERLLIARRGTAYFAQRLAELGRRRPRRRHPARLLDPQALIAHDGYNAAALCRLLDWAATGVETPMYDSTEQRAREIKEVRRAAGRGAVALTTGADQDQPRCL